MNRIVVAIFASILPLLAHAEDQRIVRYREISSKFQQLQPQQGAAGKMPRLTDPEAGALIEAMSNADEFLAGPAFGDESMNGLMDMCLETNRASVNYVFADLLSQAIPASDAEKIQRVRELTTANAHAYQDELARLQSFLVGCHAKLMPLIANFAQTLTPAEMTGIRKSGILQMRQGVIATYSGAFLTAHDPLIRAPNALRQLQAVSRTAEVYAEVLTPAQRETLVATFNTQRAGLSKEMLGLLDVIVSAMSKTSCTGLCLIE